VRLRAVLFFCLYLSGVVAMAQQTTTPAATSTNGTVVHGSIRMRVEGWDWFVPDSGDNAYAFSGNIVRISASKTTSRRDWLAELAAPILIGLPDQATSPGVQGQLGQGATYFAANSHHQTAAMVFPKQLFVRWKNIGIAGQNLRIGRFELGDGMERTPTDMVLATVKREHVNQRLIGTFGFTHVSRSFDGLEYSLNRKTAGVTVVAAIADRGVFQTDGWGWNRVGFGYAAYTFDWNKGRRSSETRVFMIEYVDWRDVLKTDNRSAAVRRSDSRKIRLETFGGHSLHVVTIAGRTVDLLAWGAVQTGRWGKLDQRAWAMDFEAGFQPKGMPALKPWLRAGFTRGSGDENSGDGKHGTFFQLLPTPRPYARFPFFNMMNIEDAFGSLTIRPHSKVTISSEFHSLRLANPNDLWYLGGGVYQPWSFGYTGRPVDAARSLANLYDVQTEYRVDSAVTLTGYFGYAAGRGVLQNIYPRGKDAKFTYAEVTHRF